MAVYSLNSMSEFMERARRRLRSLEPRPQEQSLPWTSSPSDVGEAARAYPLSPELAQAWDALETHFADGDTLQVIVTGWNRGGLLVRWGEVQGFVPASQLRQVPVMADEQEREEMLIRWVGEELEVKVIELDSLRNRLVFSERATRWGPQDGLRLLNTLNEGDICNGHVSNVCDFGVFVDLGGLDGLIHISELSWGRVTNPADLLHMGQEVQVFVLAVDRANRHVGLSLKRLQPNPWAVVEQRYNVGDIVEATITNVVDFGLFAQIEEGLEGLVHISEIADERIGHPGEVASPGDRVLVSVLKIDSTRHRLSLSMKRVDGHHTDDVSPRQDVDIGPMALLY